jgi:aminoglycoside 3-N-acetyltransferase
MVTFREVLNAFRKLEIPRTQPVIVHASLSSFGQVQGGAETIVGVLLATFDTVVAPTFTFKTMITPEVGPDNNGMLYGSDRDLNRMAEFFHPDMPADKMMGRIAEVLRCHPQAQRSSHPILSFAGVNAAHCLEAQTVDEPLDVIRMLVDQQGWALLLGVDHTVNTSIHYAERQAGRKQFIRWALTPKGVQSCPGFPGCSSGFQAVSLRLSEVVRQVQVGTAVIQAIPLPDLVTVVVDWIAEDPQALLCAREDCERCNAVRAALIKK